MQWLRSMLGSEGGAFPYVVTIHLVIFLALLGTSFAIFRIGALMLEKIASDPSHVISTLDGLLKALRFAPGLLILTYGVYLIHRIFSMAETVFIP